MPPFDLSLLFHLLRKLHRLLLVERLRTLQRFLDRGRRLVQVHDRPVAGNLMPPILASSATWAAISSEVPAGNLSRIEANNA